MIQPRSRFLLIGFILLVAMTPLAFMQAYEPEQASPTASSAKLARATFAGGCFWCMESPFDKLEGVISTTSGYTGGRTENPTYAQVKTGRTGHIESMQVQYDPRRVSFEELVSLYWHNVDPTQVNGQFCDEGNQYRSAIFFHDDEQKRVAEKTKAAVAQELGKRVVTEILKASPFYPAEDYHQDYYKKNPTKYKFFRWKCGRDARLATVWGDKAGKP